MPRLHPHPTRRNGFSLTEILVIIAIIAILAAIVFPVLTNARSKAHQATCLANQKQIGTALIAYSQDYNGALPFYFFASDESGGPSTPESSSVVRYKWMDAVFPFIKDESVFNCPGDKFPLKATDGSKQVNNGYHYRSGTDYGSYLMNATYRYDDGKRTPPCGRFKVGLTAKELAAPATTIWIADTALDPATGGLGAGFGWSCLNKSKPTLPCTKQPTPIINTSVNPPQIDRMVARHSGLVNVIYCDGHAKAISLESIANPQKSGGTMIEDGTITAFTVEDD